jgi:hypothetical protein
MLAHGAGARQSSALAPASPTMPSHKVRRRRRRASTWSPSKPTRMMPTAIALECRLTAR